MFFIYKQINIYMQINLNLNLINLELILSYWKLFVTNEGFVNIVFGKFLVSLRNEF